MSAATENYVLDANAFIQAHRKFYAFNICPGYWQALLWNQTQTRVCSIDKVRDELETGGDALWDWAKTNFAFHSTDTITEHFGEVATWVQKQSQFTPAAIAEFMDVADGWLCAYAKAHNLVLVTLEIHKPDKKTNVPLVNVCKAFNVETITPFEMLSRLGIRLGWQPC